MKQSLKNETDLLNLINKLQEQLVALDKKVDILIHRPLPETGPLPAKHNDHNKGRERYTTICADCKKECTIPFKPSGDRPVYCQDCFSRRKVIRLSGIKVNEQPKEATPVQAAINNAADIQKPKAKKKKKAVTAKKSIGKKKKR